jgi:hypothetical protein
MAFCTFGNTTTSSSAAWPTKFIPIVVQDGTGGSAESKALREPALAQLAAAQPEAGVGTNRFQNHE